MPTPQQKQAAIQMLINAFRSKPGSSSFNVKKLFLLLLTVAYLFSPLDIIPDFIPVVGLGDDVLLIIFTFFALLAGPKANIPNPEFDQEVKDEDPQEPMRNVTPPHKK